MKIRYTLIAILLLACKKNQTLPPVYNAQGEMAGEVTASSVILQSRLTISDTLINGDLPGAKGFGRFEWSRQDDFSNSGKSRWVVAAGTNDYILKVKIESLESNTDYFYRLQYGRDTVDIINGPPRKFKTLPGKNSDESVDFVVTTGMNHYRFHHGRVNNPSVAYQGADKNLGYPALGTMLSLDPDFAVFTGDNVYYDTPSEDSLVAKTLPELRRKWHEQFVQPHFVELFAGVATYWEKDDHDYRFNDCDTTTKVAPSHQLGIATFKEQVPVTDPEDKDAVTYRTYRINRFLQLWFTENRDYRSPNSMPDGPQKSIWGEPQKKWLEQTLLASDAVFKILVSPTPMVGPDDAYKADNHTNPKGFLHEGKEFLNWIGEHPNELAGFYIVCGDRHWQYHSIHPLGVEEFSVGALVDANSRDPRLPGDPKSTDPEAAIIQPFVPAKGENTGGFLRVRASLIEGEPALTMTFFDERGNVLYETIKPAVQAETVP